MKFLRSCVLELVCSFCFLPVWTSSEMCAAAVRVTAEVCVHLVALAEFRLICLICVQRDVL